MGFGGEAGFGQGGIHQFDPAVARGLSDGEAGMAHPQPGMAALFEVARHPSETEEQEIAQALLGSGEIVVLVHGPEDVILRNPPVERGDQAGEPILADGRVEILFVHTPMLAAMGERAWREPSPDFRLDIRKCS